MVVFIKSGAVATKKQPIQFDIDRFSYSLTPKQTHPFTQIVKELTSDYVRPPLRTTLRSWRKINRNKPGRVEGCTGEFYERMDLHKCDKHVYLQTRKKRKAEIAF
jgi:hypothetical protein